MTTNNDTTTKTYGVFAEAANEMEEAQQAYMDAFRRAYTDPTEGNKQAQRAAFEKLQAIAEQYRQARILLNDHVIQKRRVRS